MLWAATRIRSNRHDFHKNAMKNCRMSAEVVIPSGASVANHNHLEETEYFVSFFAGEGTVDDNGREVPIRAGDVMVTGDGACRGVRNIGSEEMRIMAVIVTN